MIRSVSSSAPGGSGSAGSSTAPNRGGGGASEGFGDVPGAPLVARGDGDRQFGVAGAQPFGDSESEGAGAADKLEEVGFQHRKATP